MIKTEFTLLEVFSAYKKLKHYFYYDNTSLFIRKRIADFEDSISENVNGVEYTDAFWAKIQEITNLLNKKGLKYWRKYFTESIRYRLTPKAFEKVRTQILTNRNQEDNLAVTRVNIFIDAEIIVHIISVLWLMTAGRHLSKFIDKDNYAYLLELTGEDNDEKVVHGLRLYKPYFIQYQNWRDNAIKKAEQLFEEKKDSVILSLDIKDYFHSVAINLKDVESDLYLAKPFLQKDTKLKTLFALLHEINTCYTNKIRKIKSLPDLKKNETILPIGLLSSGLLGNLYLKEFDRQVKDALNPAYYGRYVDDILFVLTNVEVEKNVISPVNFFLERYFIKRGILNFKKIPTTFKRKSKKAARKDLEDSYIEPALKELSEQEYLIKQLQSQSVKFNLSLKPTLEIQSRKVILQDLDGKQSPAIINNFKKNLEKNRSEFRFLPDEDQVEKDFDEEAFSLHYNDSINKLRSIKEFSEDKYGASKYLASKIFVTSFTNEKPDKKTTTQILTFFKGLIGLSFHTLWEKVATYFVINNQADKLNQFYSQTLRNIKNISFDKYEESKYRHEIKVQLATDLINYLNIAVATPLAYNRTMLRKRDIGKPTFDILMDYSKSIRYSNMIRHFWVWLPAINYTQYLYDNDGKANLLKNGISGSEIVSEQSFEINARLELLSPRYVHFHEINLLQIFKVVNSVETVCEESIEKFESIPIKAFEQYWYLNQRWKYEFIPDYAFRPVIDESRKSYFEISISDKVADNRLEKGNQVIVDIKNSDNEKTSNKKIALANIKVKTDNISQSFLGHPNKSRTRREELFKLINLVEQSKSDLFVLPEVSVPYQWIDLLAYQSCKRNVGIIAGLEHWVNRHNFAFNFMATILPIKKDHYTTCLIKIRVKNHYSHEEKKQLKGYRLFIPDDLMPRSMKKYDLFHWRKSYFSVYNCFELADISDRSLFKSKVDFIIASEYNRDTNYFSEIAGSWVRDIHCFFIQVNSSDYGDSRIIQPASSATRDIIRIKGGENAIITVGTIPIDRLRNYQLKEYDLQKEDGEFKPTPPDFDRKNVLKRIDNAAME